MITYRIFKVDEFEDGNLNFLLDYDSDKKLLPGQEIPKDFDEQDHEFDYPCIVLEVHYPNPSEIVREHDTYVPKPIAIVKELS